MAENLFPVFDMPAEMVADTRNTSVYATAPMWDFNTGDFMVNNARQPVYGTGYDAWLLWCRKSLSTQRFVHLAYSDNFGIEIAEAFAEPDSKAQESAIERTVSEALLADPSGRTQQVRDFIFEWHEDSLRVTCMIIGYDGNSAVIDADIRI